MQAAAIFFAYQNKKIVLFRQILYFYQNGTENKEKLGGFFKNNQENKEVWAACRWYT